MEKEEYDCYYCKEKVIKLVPAYYNSKKVCNNCFNKLKNQWHNPHHSKMAENTKNKLLELEKIITKAKAQLKKKHSREVIREVHRNSIKLDYKYCMLPLKDKIIILSNQLVLPVNLVKECLPMTKKAK